MSAKNVKKKAADNQIAAEIENKHQNDDDDMDISEDEEGN
jgi:hypothetical protein